MSVTNHYPLITWTVDQTSGTVTMDGGASSGTAQNINDTNMIGWEPAAISGRTDPHLWEHLAALINAETGTHGVTVDSYVWHVAPFDVGAASYQTPIPRVEMRVSTASPQSTAPEMSFDVAATAKVFGYSLVDVTAVPRAATPTDQWSFVTDVTIPNVLSFGVVGRRWDPDVGYRASRLRSPFDPSAQTTVQHSTRRAYTVEWLNASARYIDEERAGLAVYAADAGTSASDTDSTLEAMIDADQDDDRDFYLWLDASTDRKVSLIWDSDVSTQDFVSPGSLGTRRFNVSLPLIEV